MITLEGFVPVKGYEGRYLIDNTGVVYSLLSNKIMVKRKHNRNYYAYCLSTKK